MKEKQKSVEAKMTAAQTKMQETAAKNPLLMVKLVPSLMEVGQKLEALGKSLQ